MVGVWKVMKRYGRGMERYSGGMEGYGEGWF